MKNLLTKIYNSEKMPFKWFIRTIKKDKNGRINKIEDQEIFNFSEHSNNINLNLSLLNKIYIENLYKNENVFSEEQKIQIKSLLTNILEDYFKLLIKANIDINMDDIIKELQNKYADKQSKSIQESQIRV